MKTRRLLILASVALLLLLAVLVPHDLFNKPKELRAADLAVAKGQILSYTLLDDSDGKHQYIIHLSGYQAAFQIPADFAEYFARTRFESDLKNGDSLSVSILSASAEKLISKETIPVFAVRTASDTYLDEHSTLDAYNHKNNPKPVPAWTSWFPLIVAASIILLIGLACAIWKIVRAIAARPQKPKPLSDPEALYESSQRLKKILTKAAPEQISPAMAGQKLPGTADSEEPSGEPPTQ